MYRQKRPSLFSLAVAINVMIDLASSVFRKSGQIFRCNVFHVVLNDFPDWAGIGILVLRQEQRACLVKKLLKPFLDGKPGACAYGLRSAAFRSGISMCKVCHGMKPSLTRVTNGKPKLPSMARLEGIGVVPPRTPLKTFPRASLSLLRAVPGGAVLGR